MNPFDSVTVLEDATPLDKLTAPVRDGVQRLLGNGMVRDALHGVWLGHPLHPVLVQVPIGAFMSAAILDLMPGEGKAADTLIVTGMVATWPAAASGLADWSQMHVQQQRVGIVHAAANTVASGLSAAGTLVVARAVGVAEFGGYAVAVVLGGIVMIAALLNLNAVMYQELPRRPRAEHPALLSTTLAAALVLGSAAAAGTLLAAPVLRAAFGIDPGVLRYGVLLALSIGFGLLTESFLRGQQRYALVAGLRLALAAAYLTAVALFLLVLDVRAFGPYAVLLAASHVLFGVVALVGQPVRPRLVSVPLARELLRHGGYLSVTSVLLALVFGLDVIFLNRFATPEVVGAYSIYNGFPKRLLGIVFTEGVGLVLLPTLATLAKPALLRRIGRIAPLLGLAAAGLSFVAGLLLLRLLGDGYPYSLVLLALAALGIGVHTVFNLYYFALSMDSTRGAKVVIVCLLAGLLPALLVQLLLIGEFGLVGGLVAFVLTNALLLVVVLVVNARVYAQPGAACTSST